MRLGDNFTMEVVVKRKWWQLWKPRSWVEIRDFTVMSEAWHRGYREPILSSTITASLDPRTYKTTVYGAERHSGESK